MSEPIALDPAPQLPQEAKTAMGDARAATIMLPDSARTIVKIGLHVVEAALVVWLHRAQYENRPAPAPRKKETKK